jgi:hypothetical protein
MKLEKFRKNNNKKIYIIIISLVTILNLGGILTYYKSHAYYKEEKVFNVIKGRIPYFKTDNGDIKITYTFLGEQLDIAFPSKNAGYVSNIVTCNDGVDAIWDNSAWGLKIVDSNDNTEITCNIDFSFAVFFDYTGDVQTFTIPYDGTYKLETWGAQGGNAYDTYIGGYGGYSTGEIYLEKDQVLYIIVGGAGETANNNSKSGGYNGGGSSKTQSSNDYAGSGGGATHIAFSSGLLKTLADNLNDVLIVSGGGGGAYYYPSFNSSGGNAGGYIGGLAPTGICSGRTLTIGSTASQTSEGTYNACEIETENGSFGQGGNGTVWSSGGGSGLYGGGSGYAHGSNGGSSYIGNSLLTNKVMYCYNCEESDEESTKTVSTTNVSREPTSEFAKKGNGYVKITIIEKDS